MTKLPISASGQHFVVLGANIGHERVLAHFGERHPLHGVLLEQTGDEVLGLRRQVPGHLELGEHDLVERVAHALRVERRPARQEREHHAAERPDVGLEAVRVARGDLGRDEVGRGEVAVEDGVGVEVDHAVDDLLHEVARLVLVEALAAGLEVALHLAVRAHLEHQVDVVLVLEEGEELEDGRMLQLVVDLDFVFDARCHARGLHYFLVNLEGRGEFSVACDMFL